MVELSDYVGREQSYVKHVFLEGYLDRLVHKTASTYSHIVYVDGFAGPWQSFNEYFEDTSFGIALNALRRAKASWKERNRVVKMSAFLVERDEQAYRQLTQIPARFPDIAIKTYVDDFLTMLPQILKDTPGNAFAFFLIDPKGWRIPLGALSSMLARPNSEVIFNFMFDFINRAASIDDPAIIRGLNELIPYGDWRAKLDEAEQRAKRKLNPTERKAILVGAFTRSLAQLGNYPYVAETTVLRPISDRPLYCLCYATRNKHGIKVFRESQIKALSEQAKTRAATKMKLSTASTGQGEFFESLYEMGPNELSSFLKVECNEAVKTLLELVPKAPNLVRYDAVWPQVLLKHVVKLSDVNKIVANLRADANLLLPDWETGRRAPQEHYRMQRT